MGLTAVMLGCAGSLDCLIKFLTESAQNTLQFILIDGLGDVVLHTVAHSFPGIGKVGIAADDNDPTGKTFLSNCFCYFKAGHTGHPDIHQHHVGLQCADLR